MTSSAPHSDELGTPYSGTFTVRDAVIDLMRRLGMTSVFGNPGSTELPLFRDFPADFRYVLGLQEAVVVGMADGYAQATDNASFVNLHSAAGVGNAMGNIFTAFRNRTPIVITAGQQARAILPFDPFLASAQATELPKPYVKWSIEPARAEDVSPSRAHITSRCRSRAVPCWCRFRSTTGTVRPNACRCGSSAPQRGLSRGCLGRSAPGSMPVTVRRSSSARRSIGRAHGTTS